MADTAAKHQRITLARVEVGDELMTTTDEDGIVGPYRFADGTVRTVDDVVTRKAGPDEMPGRLIVLAFTDGTRTGERYGTTGHYRADTFRDDQ